MQGIAVESFPTGAFHVLDEFCEFLVTRPAGTTTPLLVEEPAQTAGAPASQPSGTTPPEIEVRYVRSDWGPDWTRRALNKLADRHPDELLKLQERLGASSEPTVVEDLIRRPEDWMRGGSPELWVAATRFAEQQGDWQLEEAEFHVQAARRIRPDTLQARIVAVNLVVHRSRMALFAGRRVDGRALADAMRCARVLNGRLLGRSNRRRVRAFRAEQGAQRPAWDARPGRKARLVTDRALPSQSARRCCTTPGAVATTSWPHRCTTSNAAEPASCRELRDSPPLAPPDLRSCWREYVSTSRGLAVYASVTSGSSRPRRFSRATADHLKGG